MNNTKNLLALSSLMMALGIIIGAFGAHILKDYLNTYEMSIFQKGISYHFYNTLGMFCIAFCQYLYPRVLQITKAFYIVFIGSVIFSFFLYALAITKIMYLGAIVPIGGILMIIGWLYFSYILFSEDKQ